jgi:hypothetical protein
MRPRLAEQIRALEVQRSRSLLPPIAAARGSRIGVDLNITGSQFGSALVWKLRFEDGSVREGAQSTADCPELWRGESAGAWITRRRFELPLDLPPGYHELQAQVGGGPMQSCLLIMSPPACYEPPRSSPAGASGASPCSSTRCVRATTGASATSAIWIA